MFEPCNMVQLVCPTVHADALHKSDVHPQVSVPAGALETDYDPEVNARPSGCPLVATVHTLVVAWQGFDRA